MRVAAALIALLAGAAAARAAPPHRVPLSGESGVASWSLTNANRSIVLPVTVPGYALEALRAAGLAGDPLYRRARGRRQIISKPDHRGAAAALFRAQGCVAGGQAQWSQFQ